MKRVYPPYGFHCPYTNNCPHLDFLSTTWVFEEYERANEVYEEHLHIIDRLRSNLDASLKRIRDLEKENAELKAKNTALHRRQFKANKKLPGAPHVSGKKRGSPTGHPGWRRALPARVDRTIPVDAPTVCPHCGSKNMTTLPGTTVHLQEDLVLVKRPAVTRYLHGMSYCTRCRRTVLAPAADEIIHAPIGPATKSVATYLRYAIGISYRKVQHILSDLFGIACVPASLVGFDRKAAQKGSALYDDLREKVRASAVVHADETSWRSDGEGHYVWYAGNDELAYFHIDRHRSAETAKAIFGTDFAGIIVRDRYAAYNGIGQWQSCLAHIVTRCRELIKEHPAKDHHVEYFLGGVIDLCVTACKAGRTLRSGQTPWKKAAILEKQFAGRLKKLCIGTLAFKPAETLRAYLAGPDRHYLFTFLRHPGVPPTNNQAERSLRHMVIFRKLCFGNRSPHGLYTHSVLPSLIQTARRQGVHPREFLQVLLTADTSTAQAALYRNTS